MTKIALLVLFNHRYDKNIPKLRRLYSNKFSHIFFLVPFYDGNDSDVIPVYGNSFHFATYISQAYSHIRNLGFTHYFVVADDMIINPSIDEQNLWAEIGISTEDCYMPRIVSLQQQRYWAHVVDALKFKVKTRGVEISNILPSKEEAIKRLSTYGCYCPKVPYKGLVPKQVFSKIYLNNIWELARNRFSLSLDYPLVGGYCDILLIPEKVMLSFCQISGAFSAAGLFVEVAIPSTLLLITDKLKMDCDVKLKEGDMWRADTLISFEKEYEMDVKKLLDNYPKDILFYHPIKFSKWRY